jgi:carboxyl-terminal processing protease
MRFKLATILFVINNVVANVLTQEDAQRIIKTFLDFHVDQKSITESLYSKLKKNFINFFDSDKSYLLESEVQDFNELDPVQVNKNIEILEKGKFDAWQKEFYAFKYSVQRARSIRHEIYRQLLLELQYEGSSLSQNQLIYARDIQELKDRWYKKINRFLSQEMKFAGLQSLSFEQKKLVFDLLEKRVSKHEEKFLSKDRLTAFHEHFLKSFAKSLDAHSAFFTKQEGLELKKSLEKQFDGVGISLRESILGVIVLDTVPNAPAFNAGIKKGDILLFINGQDVTKMSYEEILKYLEGPKGSEVRLSLLRGSSKEAYQVILQRQTVVLADGRIKTTHVPYGNGVIGIVKLSSFYDNKMGASSEIDLKEAISHLKKHYNVLGIILDLRQNSGGFLSQAVKVAGLFMKTGVVAVSRYAHGRVSYLRDLDPNRYYEGPLVVLTSKASASAAEVVAAALQDYGRALIIGDDRTYGKGSIQFQNVTEADAKNYFKVTVGRYFTVSGKTTQIDGVKADIHVPSFYHPFNIGERFLDNPLSSDRIAPHYIDPLIDIDESKKAWFQKNYLPYLQTKEIFWSQCLDCLKSNSQFRIENSSSYQKFLEEPLESQKRIDEDPPLKEAVLILKDALILKDHETKSCIKSS